MAENENLPTTIPCFIWNAKLILIAPACSLMICQKTSFIEKQLLLQFSIGKWHFKNLY